MDYARYQTLNITRRGIINWDKPIVSVMHGPAVGAGLVAGLLADISITTKTAGIVDGHPLDKVRAEQLAAPGRAEFRHVTRAGVHGLWRAGCA